jgi:hypothetical protein
VLSQTETAMQVKTKSQKNMSFDEIVQKMISDKDYIVQKIKAGKKNELKDKFKFAKGL